MTTEKSADEAVLDSVFSSSRDRGSTTAPPVEAEPTSEAPPPDAPKSEPDKAKAEPDSDASKPKGYRDPETGRFVPLEELKSEREKRQEAQKARDEEARLRMEAEARLKAYQEQAEANQRRQQAQQNPPPPPPDPLMDPTGAFSHLQQQFQTQILSLRLDQSEARARDKFGDATVDAAVQAAVKAGVIRNFLNSPDAYRDLITWNKRQETLARVGDDPDAYEKSIAERVRAQVLEELKTGKTTATGEAQPPQRFPGSLIDATASGAQGAQSISDEALLGGIFSSGRKRR